MSNMVHSMAGGHLREKKFCDFVMVSFDVNPEQSFWFVSEIPDIMVGDYVLAPYGIIDELQRAKVLQVHKNVESTNFPLRTRNMKYIFKKI